MNASKSPAIFAYFQRFFFFDGQVMTGCQNVQMTFPAQRFRMSRVAFPTAAEYTEDCSALISGFPHAGQAGSGVTKIARRFMRLCRGTRITKGSDTSREI